MLNTYGTILRIILLAALLMGGWFALSALGYGVIAALLGYPFEWNRAWIVFGIVIGIRMISPRNVFRR